MALKIGEKVIYPNQGVGVVEDICVEDIAGSTLEFYKLKMMSGNSTVMIPIDNVALVGLRKLCSKSELADLLELLKEVYTDIKTDWKDRYKNNVERMASGSIFEVAKVLRNLHVLSFGKSLSFREKKMFDRAKDLIVTEIATVQRQPVSAAKRLVEEMLVKGYEEVES